MKQGGKTLAELWGRARDESMPDYNRLSAYTQYSAGVGSFSPPPSLSLQRPPHSTMLRPGCAKNR